jgi:NADH dehydrogenase
MITDTPDKPADDPRPHVVILGAGFGGLECAKALKGPWFRETLKDSRFRVTVIDRQNHHLFQPLLYQVATAGLAAPDIAEPVRSILRKQQNATVLMDEAMSVDAAAKTVKLASGATVHYDWLVVAMGVKTGWFGHNEWEAHALGLKSLADAHRIRAQALQCYEHAEAGTSPRPASELLTTVVVGGGPTGVEMAGSLAELARRVLKRDFRRIDPSSARVILIEGGSRLLAAFPEELSKYTAERLIKMGVTVKLNTTVENITEGVVRAGGVEYRAGTIVWAAGVEAPAFTRTLGTPLDRAGRLITEKDCSLPGQSRIFAIGDIAATTDGRGVRVPGLCPAAIQMGRHAARVISQVEMRKGRFETEGERPAFIYFDKGIMATIGRSSAVAVSKGIKMTGFIAWMAWLFIHLLFLIGFRNKLFVMMQWLYAYTTWRRGARIMMRP